MNLRRGVSGFQVSVQIFSTHIRRVMGKILLYPRPSQGCPSIHSHIHASSTPFTSVHKSIIHLCITNEYIYSCMHASIHISTFVPVHLLSPSVHPSTYQPFHSSTYPCICSSILPPTNTSMYSLIHLFIHLLTHSCKYSSIHPCIHSYIHPIVYSAIH